MRIAIKIELIVPLDTPSSHHIVVTMDISDPLLRETLYGTEDNAIAILRSSTGDPEYIHPIYSINALITACSRKMPRLALEIINTKSHGNPDVIAAQTGETPLTYACRNSMEHVAEALLNTGRALPGHVTVSLENAIIIATRRKLLGVVNTILSIAPESAAQQNKNGDTALIFACWNKLEDTAINIIRTGHSNETAVNFRGVTALLYACYNNLYIVAAEILDGTPSHGAYGHVTPEGITALMKACQMTDRGYVAMKILALPGHGSPETVTVKEGATALMVAIKYGGEDYLIRKIVETGVAMPVTVDKSGKSIADIAAECRSAESCRFIRNICNL